MGIGYRIDKVLDCAVVVWDGRVTAEEQREHLVRLAADRQWPPGVQLTDLTTVTDVTLPHGDLIDALTEGMNMREELETAILVRPDFLAGTWVDDAVKLRGAIPKPFSELDRACAHLGVSTAAIQVMIDQVRRSLARTGA